MDSLTQHSMVFKTIKKLVTDGSPSNESASNAVLIVEDDPDQMDLLVGLAEEQINKLLVDKSLSLDDKRDLKDIEVQTSSNIESLEKLLKSGVNVVFALVDCNLPDSEGGESNDQFVLENYRITGQHRSVDLLVKFLPETPITLISSYSRFQKMVIQHYRKHHDFELDFVKKWEAEKIQQAIENGLRASLASG